MHLHKIVTENLLSTWTTTFQVGLPHLQDATRHNCQFSCGRLFIDGIITSGICTNWDRQAVYIAAKHTYFLKPIPCRPALCPTSNVVTYHSWSGLTFFVQVASIMIMNLPTRHWCKVKCRVSYKNYITYKTYCRHTKDVIVTGRCVVGTCAVNTTIPFRIAQ